MTLTWIINIIFLLLSTILPSPVLMLEDITRASESEYSEVTEVIEADKAVVLSEDGRYLLLSKQADTPQPIASITKLMTALVFLETESDLTKIYKIDPSDAISGGKLHLFTGEELSFHDLFLTSLIASDNGATMALVHASSLSEDEFIAKMNERAKELRLLKTSFADPTGLSPLNVSTARETALLTLEAFKRPEIREALALKEHRFKTLGGREKHIKSTDHLLFDKSDNAFIPRGGKTGYIDEAGYCFSGLFQMPDGQILVATVLNSDGRNNRFVETKKIVSWVLNSLEK